MDTTQETDTQKLGPETSFETNFWLIKRYGFIRAAMARYLFLCWGSESGSLIISDERLRRNFGWLTDEKYRQARDQLDQIRGLHFKAYNHRPGTWEVKFQTRLAQRLQDSEQYELFDSEIFVKFGESTSVFYAQARQVCEKYLKENSESRGMMRYNANWHWRHRFCRLWSPEAVEKAVSALVHYGYLKQPSIPYLMLPDEDRKAFLQRLNEEQAARYAHYRPDWCPWVLD